MDFAPKARMSSRGAHPDLNPEGELRADIWMTRNTADLDHDREMADPARAQHFMAQVAAAQSLEHPDVQATVAGQSFGTTPSSGLREYRQTIQTYRQWLAEQHGASVYVDDADIATMPLERYEQLFDEGGRPREGVYYWPSRSTRLSDQIDGGSAREAGSNR